MSYRYYIGMISNKRLREIKNVANYKELHEKIYPYKPYDNEDEYIGVYDIQELSLHCFGNDADYLQDMPKKSQKKIFLNKDFNELVTSDNCFFLTDKSALLHTIEFFRDKMERYYQKRWALSIFLEVLTTSDKETIQEWKEPFSKACSYVFDDKFNYNRYNRELSDINIPLDELFKEHNSKIREKAIEHISAEMLNYFRNQLEESQNNHGLFFYNLDESKPFKISDSANFSNFILQLVHILKTFDFRKNKLVVYGY